MGLDSVDIVDFIGFEATWLHEALHAVDRLGPPLYPDPEGS